MKETTDYISKNVFDGVRPVTTYASLRNKSDLAVDAMIRADSMWSINSISRLRRAWLAAVDALEAEAQRSVGENVERASHELSGRADGE